MPEITPYTGAPKDPHHLELFAGGVPPYASFTTDLYYIRDVMRKFPDTELEDGPPNPATTTCFIALVAHFEAFTKDLFAAVINVCPKTLDQFAERRGDETLRLGDLVHVEFNLARTLGFLVAERRDFGSPKGINMLFNDLLGVTPFSKDELARFNDLLDLRNLFVHHGGVYTCGYARRHGLPTGVDSEVFYQSPDFDMEGLEDAISFFEGVAIKITRASWNAISTGMRAHAWRLAPYQAKAVNYLMVGIDRGWHDASGGMKHLGNRPPGTRSARKKIDKRAQQDIRSFKQAPKAKPKKRDDAKLF